jgi:hypothetical protein
VFIGLPWRQFQFEKRNRFFDSPSVIRKPNMTEPSATSDARPSNVVWFERLMYFMVLIEVIFTILQWDQLMAQAPQYYGAAATGTLFGILTDVLFIWLVARRRKSWVRWLLLVPVVFGIPYGIVTWPPATPVSYAVPTCLSWLAQAVAVFLIFTGNSREWFRVSQHMPANSA